MLLAGVLAGCAAGPSAVPAKTPGTAAEPASPAGADATPDILLIGETHDAAGQPELVVAQLQRLAARGRLAAVALEMAPLGATTVALTPDADDAALRRALRWDERAWPWARYAPVVRAGLAARVPVVGANLPADQMRTAMEDVSLDAQLAPDVRRAQEEAIRTGHCGLLPERQIGPMTRVQIGRDRAMALTLAESVMPGRTACCWRVPAMSTGSWACRSTCRPSGPCVAWRWWPAARRPAGSSTRCGPARRCRRSITAPACGG